MNNKNKNSQNIIVLFIYFMLFGAAQNVIFSEEFESSEYQELLHVNGIEQMNKTNIYIFLISQLITRILGN